MEKRKRHHGSGQSPAISILRRRIISSNLAATSLTASEVVVHLRSRFREYSRLPNKTFANNVEGILTSLCQKLDDDDELEKRKSAKKSDGDCKSRANDSESSLAIAEVDNFSKNSSSSLPDDSFTSTPDSNNDAVSNATMEPEFDLMKSMLRDNYVEKNKSVRELALKVGKNTEMKTEEDSMRKMDATDKDGRKLEKDEISMKSESASTSNGEPSFKNLGGMNGLLKQLEEEVLFPLCHPKEFQVLGASPVTGIFLHGPPGCGKTTLARAIANEAGVPFYMISATDVVSGVSGASEENIRDLFEKAHRTAPSIIFIDEIDAIASKRENLQKVMEVRIVTQLMTCMDASYQATQSNDNNDLVGESSEIKLKYVLVIGATNRPDAVDGALRRPGRLDLEIALGFPDENARFEILSVHTKKLKVEGNIDLRKIARSTAGFVGADLKELANKAGRLAGIRISDGRGERLDGWWRQPFSEEETNSLRVSMSDFEEAIKRVQPSSRREGFSSIPSTKWDDIGGLESIREKFERYIVQRIKQPEDYEELGMDMAVGFLLFGPPGCGKTSIAKAVANEAGANFIHIKGPELLNKYVGESELAVRTIFTRARTCSPCVLFIDEVDAITSKRGQDRGRVVEGLLKQLLIELDGADERQGVYVIGATNRVEVMDPAILRPGRLGKILYVPLPNDAQRGHILKTLARRKPIAADVDLDAIARVCHNFTGADLFSLLDAASMAALTEKQIAIQSGSSSNSGPLVINKSHLETVKIFPSVSKEERIHYKRLAKKHHAI